METKQPLSYPHSPAYHALLRAGPHLKLLQQVHAHLIVSGFGRNRALLTKLIKQVCATRSIDYTRRIFLATPDPDSFLFNSIIKATSKFHFSLDSVLFYRQMIISLIPPSNYTFTSVIKACADLSVLSLGRGIHTHVLVYGYGLDIYVQAALVAFYAKSGYLDIARKVFDRMPDRSIVAWNSMISGYEHYGLAKEAIELFEQMQEMGVEPDSPTFVSLLSACAQTGALGLGCWVHEHVVSNGFDMNVVLGTSLINMYARCGNVGKAREVFDSMSELNVVTWTAMISGYGTNGYSTEAVWLFGQMRVLGASPNSVTFVAVLSACAHGGLVDEGWRVFASMSHEYGLVPGMEHHVCMVDMLGRAGLLSEAYQFIRELVPGSPAPAVWTAMLGACKMHKNFVLGVEVAEHLLSVEPENPGHYVMLSNIYALAGRMDRVEMVRNIMIRRSLKKQVGYSTIEVNQKTYLFSMGDKSHPESNEIYQYLDDLMLRCREAGYVALPESVMHEVEEEERDHALRYHSEKLAIAFGLIFIPPGLPIRVVKNLRVCVDCHNATKYISKITKREILVRDAVRFHLFKDGTCSCGDFW